MTKSVNLVPFWAFAPKKGELFRIYTSQSEATRYRKTCLARVAGEWLRWCSVGKTLLTIDDDGTPNASEYPTSIVYYPIGTANAEDWGRDPAIDWSANAAEEPVTVELSGLALAHAKIAQLETELAELKGKHPGNTLLDLLTGPVMPGEDLFAERADDGYLYEDCKAWWTSEHSIDAPPPEFVVHGDSLIKLRKFGSNKDCALAVIDALNRSVGRMINLFDKYTEGGNA